MGKSGKSGNLAPTLKSVLFVFLPMGVFILGARFATFATSFFDPFIYTYYLYLSFLFTQWLSGLKRENLVRRYLIWRHVSYINHCLVRRLEGAVFMIITRQVIGCVFESLSQQKTLKQKTDTSLSRCPTFCSFLEHSSFPINRFFFCDKPYATHTICFFSTHAPL